MLSGNLLIASCCFGWLLLALGWIDAKTYLLPDVLTFLLETLGLIVAALFMRDHLLDHIIGAAAGFLTFGLLAWIYRRLRHRDGLGLGDAKLLGALGAWDAWSGLPTIVFLAAFLALGAVTIRSVILRTDVRATMRIPFGVFLAISGWLVWLYGPLSIG